MGQSAADYAPVSLPQMRELLAASFAASEKMVLQRMDEIVTIRSNRSCRFVVAEFDGLVRICLSNDDPDPDFSGLDAELTEVSRLLTDTDLFDYI